MDETQRYIFQREEDPPLQVRDKVVYVVGDRSKEWLAILKCPCGCGDIIQLNLLQSAAPCWRVRFHKRKKITIRPSIDRVVGCRSHFTLRNGIINWVWED
jgi:hypothetical protein